MQARLWMDAPAALLDSCRRDFGDRFTLRLGRFGTLVIVSDPEGVAEVMALPDAAFHCRPFNESYRYAMGDHALFLADGAPHRRLKPLLIRALAGLDMTRHATAVAAATDAAMARWPEHGAVAARPWTHEVTLAALAALVFGDSAAGAAFTSAIRDRCWSDLRSWKPWTALSRIAPEIVALVCADLDARRAAPPPTAPALLDALLAARDAGGAGLSEAEIADQVRMLAITAGDATAVALAWALIRVAGAPGLQERLRAEIAAAGPAAAQDARACPLLAATCAEVLRLHTVLPTISGRNLTAPRDLLGHHMPAGVTVAPCEYLLHRRADLYDAPLEFRPERFLGGTPPPPHYFPFGFGTRACLGGTLVPLTLRVALARVLSRRALAPEGDAPAPGRHGTLLAPAASAQMRVAPLTGAQADAAPKHWAETTDGKGDGMGDGAGDGLGDGPTTTDTTRGDHPMPEATMTTDTGTEPAARVTAETAGTLVDLLRARAAATPDARAYAFLADGGTLADTATYGELDADARRLALALRATAAPGDRVLVAFTAGVDMVRAFFGCLYAGLVPVPAPPPEASRRKRTLPRLMSIVADADIALVLSSGDTAALLRTLAAETPDLAALRIVDVADVVAPGAAAALPEPWQPPATAPDDLAYLQYTSGSTTTPKGVMLTHRNVLHHCRDLRRELLYDASSASLTWLPYYHDYGLIEGLLTPLVNGTPAYIMSPFSFLKRPVAWLDAMSRYRCTHSQGPNFAYDQCVRRLRPGQAEAMDLSHVVSLGNGAEPINAEVTERFHAAFAPSGLTREALCPAYGLAEATLMMTCRRPGEPPRVLDVEAAALRAGRARPAQADAEANGPATLRLTSCGRPLGAIEVAIVDPGTRARRAEGEVGEIWLRDAAIAQGYWKRPDDSDAVFRAEIAGTGERPFLRTGDLGFLEGGELFVTSRIKDLVIVAGQNHAPQDIEWTVERCHPAMRPQGVAAASTAVGGEEKLVVVAETERGALAAPEAAQEIVAAIRRACTESHEVPPHAVLLLRRGSLPKTASGKIQRHACAAMIHAPGPDVAALWITGMAAPDLLLDRVEG